MNEMLSKIYFLARCISFYKSLPFVQVFYSEIHVHLKVSNVSRRAVLRSILVYIWYHFIYDYVLKNRAIKHHLFQLNYSIKTRFT